MNNTLENQVREPVNRTVMIVIGILSIVVPGLVAYLILGSKATRIEGLNVSFLPHLNAILNTTTFFLLVMGGLFIKRKQIVYHRTAMMSAFVISAIFLISYVIYHNNVESAKYGGEGAIRYIYLFILASHILLSMIIVPLVLLAIYFAWTKRYASHRKIVKWAYPIWLYVAASGVIVYLMISPYYVH